MLGVVDVPHLLLFHPVSIVYVKLTCLAPTSSLIFTVKTSDRYQSSRPPLNKKATTLFSSFFFPFFQFLPAPNSRMRHSDTDDCETVLRCIWKRSEASLSRGHFFVPPPSCACISRWPICLIMAAPCSSLSSWLFGVGGGCFWFVPFLWAHLVNTCCDTSTLFHRSKQTLLEFKAIYTILCQCSCFCFPLNSSKHIKLFNWDFNTVNTLQSKHRRSPLCDTFVSE